MNKPKTIFIDIDGTILHYDGDIPMNEQNQFLLSDIREKFAEWFRKSYTIILTTARKESLRRMTETILNNYGIHYDMLIMGLPTGARVIINDKKTEDSEPKALAINVIRNEGLKNIDI